VSNSKHSIDVWIVMNESGAFVEAEDPEIANELAEQEFEHEDVRQLQVTVIMSPANGMQVPAKAQVEID
jgi:hypothetical protein